jgi:hypothetical protein
MINDILIGPVIVGNHMTGHNYLHFSQNRLPNQLEDIPLATWIAMYFQNDRVSSQYTRLVMQHHNDSFPNRWIGNWTGQQNL